MMPKPIEVVYFPKRCEHGVPMRLVKKLSGTWWYENECEECWEKLLPTKEK